MHMRPLIPSLGALILVLVAASIPGCGGNKSTTSITQPPTKELDSGTIAPNGVYTHTFANAGAYNYHCTFHGGMTGTVTVVAGGNGSASVDIGDNSFTPASTSVPPGTTVTWTNNGNSNHTVTSN